MCERCGLCVVKTPFVRRGSEPFKAGFWVDRMFQVKGGTFVREAVATSSSGSLPRMLCLSAWGWPHLKGWEAGTTLLTAGAVVVRQKAC